MTKLASVPGVGARPQEDRVEIVARAREVAKVLRRNAEQTDREGLIPEENLAAVRDAGLSLLLQPRRFGGTEVDLRTSLEVQMALGEGCGSTSWVVGLGNVSSFLLALFPEQTQQEVWKDDIHARISCVTAPAGAKLTEVEGGWRISGKWRYGSGSAYAKWAVLGVPLPVPDDPNRDSRDRSNVGLALVPLSAGHIEKSWDVTGMRGTRSDTIVMEDVFVPKHRQLTYTALREGTPDSLIYDTNVHTLYRTPFPSVFGLCIAASQVGVAKEALRFGIEFAPQRIHPYSLRPLSEESTVQTLFGEAAYKVDSAELHLLRAADDADLAAREGRWLTGPAGQRGLIDGLAAAHYSVEGVRLMIRALMSSSFNNSNPMQRFWRDCEIADNHIGWSNFQLEGYGKALLGVGERIA